MARGEADALRDEQLGVVLAALGTEDAVLAIDESGFVKQGKKSVGVKGQYYGASGQIDNCQVGVFVSWQTSKGHALIDRALYLPKEWAEDQGRRRVAGVPAEVELATKPALARGLVKRVRAAGARPAWAVADAVYGGDYKLRSALKEAGQLLCAGRHRPAVRLAGLGGTACQGRQDPGTRERLGGDQRGSRSPGVARFRLAALRINHPHGKAWQRFLLRRRSRSDTRELTACLAFGAAETTLQELAQVAGRRRSVEESFAQSKGEVGLAPPQDPRHDRPSTLGLSPARGSSLNPRRVETPWRRSKKPRAAGSRRRLIRVGVAEVRRFFVALLWGTTRGLLTQVLRWSNWRRHHQVPAKFFRYKTRRALAHLQLSY